MNLVMIDSAKNALLELKQLNKAALNTIDPTEITDKIQPAIDILTELRAFFYSVDVTELIIKLNQSD